MKTILLFLLAASTCAAQSVSVAAGAGYGALNSAWKNAAPVWSAGMVIDNPIGQKAGTMIGLHYRQRGEKRTTLHTVQADFAGQYIGTRIRAGAGAFFSLAAGSVSESETPRKFGSGVGLSVFAAYRLWRGLSVRVVYDHGLTNLVEVGESVTAQGAYLLLEYRL